VKVEREVVAIWSVSFVVLWKPAASIGRHLNGQ
jgi:hypothetical protein